jgi:hypothetical protein
MRKPQLRSSPTPPGGETNLHEAACPIHAKKAQALRECTKNLARGDGALIQVEEASLGPGEGALSSRDLTHKSASSRSLFFCGSTHSLSPRKRQQACLHHSRATFVGTSPGRASRLLQ